MYLIALYEPFKETEMEIEVCSNLVEKNEEAGDLVCLRLSY